MNNKKGVSKLVIILIIAAMVVGVYFWLKYFSEPLTTIVTGGAQQSLPALDKAKKVSETVNKAIRARDEATKKLEDLEKDE